MGYVKNQAMKKGLTDKQENSYERYFYRLEDLINIDELVEEGGAESIENFKRQVKKRVKDKGYYDALKNKGRKDRTFKGRDGKTRKSKFQASYDTLGEAIYNEYIRPLKDDRVQLIEYKRKGKTKMFYTVRKAVSKGQKITFKGKTYKGGQFLPSGFKVRKGA